MSETTLDIREKGRANGKEIYSDRRLFMQFLGFGEVTDVAALVKSLEESGMDAVLYEDVNDARGVGLLTVPWALGARGAHEFVEGDEFGADRRGEARYVDRGQVIGLERTVEIVPTDRSNGLVGQTEALQHDDRLGGAVVDRQLDVGQHVARITLGHEQRADRKSVV